jgi:hypothetical protein
MILSGMSRLPTPPLPTPKNLMRSMAGLQWLDCSAVGCWTDSATDSHLLTCQTRQLLCELFIIVPNHVHLNSTEMGPKRHMRHLQPWEPAARKLTAEQQTQVAAALCHFPSHLWYTYGAGPPIIGSVPPALTFGSNSSRAGPWQPIHLIRLLLIVCSPGTAEPKHRLSHCINSTRRSMFDPLHPPHTQPHPQAVQQLCSNRYQGFHSIKAFCDSTDRRKKIKVPDLLYHPKMHCPPCAVPVAAVHSMPAIDSLLALTAAASSNSADEFNAGVIPPTLLHVSCHHHHHHHHQAMTKRSRRRPPPGEAPRPTHLSSCHAPQQPCRVAHSAAPWPGVKEPPSTGQSHEVILSQTKLQAKSSSRQVTQQQPPGHSAATLTPWSTPK